jgi:hypothetical protein
VTFGLAWYRAALVGAAAASLYGRSTSTNQLEDQRDDGQHQQNVNKSTKRIAANNAEQPQYKQNYKDCPKHFSSPSLTKFAL